MQKRQSVFPVSPAGSRSARAPEGENAITVTDLARYTQGWLMTGQIEGYTSRTLTERARFIRLLLWFLNQQEYTHCGAQELRHLLAYVREGPPDGSGRWGSSSPRAVAPVRPRTVELWHEQLTALGNWLVLEGAIETNPMARLKAPKVPEDEITPFTDAQLDALYRAARSRLYPRRNVAILDLLLDTGMRANELCTLTVGAIDWQEWSCTVHGKGNKDRSVPFGRRVKASLWKYLQEQGERSGSAPLFIGERGHTPGETLTPSGLHHIIQHLGKAAGLENVRCSPHTFRHTFAVSFLRNGGQEFTLMRILGHTSLTMTRRYVALARADIQAQHARCSPVDRRGNR